MCIASSSTASTVVPSGDDSDNIGVIFGVIAGGSVFSVLITCVFSSNLEFGIVSF